MPAPTLTAAALDQAAARIIRTDRLTEPERDAWAGITNGYQRTAPAAPAARQLLTATVDELVADALGELDRAASSHGTRPAIDVKLPGRLARVLPDWAHRTRADLSHKPSTQLAVSAEILRKWGWQQKPHHLRNGRGQRCICGAIITAVRLGVGNEDNAEQAAGYILAELRETHRWNALIGDWNGVHGRTADQAIDLVTAAQRRALAAGR